MSFTLYVNRVAKDDLSGLEDLFATVGDVTRSRLEKFPDSGHVPEFGVFEMATEQQATDCVERFNGHNCADGRYLSVSTSAPRMKPVVIPEAKPRGKASHGRRKM